MFNFRINELKRVKTYVDVSVMAEPFSGIQINKRNQDVAERIFRQLMIVSGENVHVVS